MIFFYPQVKVDKIELTLLCFVIWKYINKPYQISYSMIKFRDVSYMFHSEFSQNPIGLLLLRSCCDSQLSVKATRTICRPVSFTLSLGRKYKKKQNKVLRVSATYQQVGKNKSPRVICQFYVKNLKTRHQ